MRYLGETEPALAVSVSDFKSSIHGESGTYDDAVLAIHLRAAQEAVETATGCLTSSGSYEFTFPLLPRWRRWWFPCRPVTEIIGLAVDDGAGGWTDMGSDDVLLLHGHDEPQMKLPEGWGGFDKGGDAVRVQATCGHVAALKWQWEAIILLAKEWYDAGIAFEGATEAPRLSMGALALIRQHRYMRPRVTSPC
ncbi:hypothetical protein [Pseudooceanicola sp.]|uniref:hypothetical protein n=1 Tax=Pseudooceanicola sp. TaxID=1914328 RepID=UPI004059E7F9